MDKKIPAYAYYCLHMTEGILNILTKAEFEETKEHWCDGMCIRSLTKDEDKDLEVYLGGSWCTMLLIKKKIQ